MRAEYIVISIIIAVIVLAIALMAVSGAPGVVTTIVDMFGKVK